jgi:homoserine dehydrogenase
MRVLLIGFGPVGRAFAGLIEERRAMLRARYGLDLELAAIASSSAAWLRDPRAGSPGADALRGAASPAELVGRIEPWNGADALDSVDADVLVEATSGGGDSGEPAAGHVRAALSRRMHVVAASKGAFVWHYRELRDLARRSNVELRIGAATGAALPTIDTARYGLAGAEIERIEGILNGTSNYILTRMREGGTYADALRDAQGRGVAEADPRTDVEGTDTATKLVLLANALFDAGLTLADVPTTGITQLAPDDLARAVERGERIRLLGTLEGGTGAWRARVEPVPLGADHPLARVDGLEKGITYQTDTMARVTVIGGRSDPNGAAGALLRDIVNLASG